MYYYTCSSPVVLHTQYKVFRIKFIEFQMKCAGANLRFCRSIHITDQATS